MQKRLELARALATNPKLLMLDECMAGLTSTEVNESVNLIKSLRDKGITFLIVEHIMEAVMPIADKVVVLNGGVRVPKIALRQLYRIIVSSSLFRTKIRQKMSAQ